MTYFEGIYRDLDLRKKPVRKREGITLWPLRGRTGSVDQDFDELTIIEEQYGIKYHPPVDIRSKLTI